ncbi:MAG: Dabb family protein [Proteobacteria bacterium]|nr:Dabb family protein [Pseudomonadota bacterium]
MIHHIVLFRLKERSPFLIEKMVDRLKTLEGKIELIRSFEVGFDQVKGDRSYDIALTAKFNTFGDLRAYQDHPAHVEVAERISKGCDSVVVVDYEIKSEQEILDCR